MPFSCAGVWSEEPADNPPAGPAHLWIADVWEEPAESSRDGTADTESAGDALFLVF